MGKVMSTAIRRPAQNWNIENRAQREIERHKAKPKQAPIHPSTEESIENFRKDHPELLDAQRQKNEALHLRLHGLLASPDRIPEPQSRPLPEDRSTREEPEYGYLEPAHITKGFCSIRQALAFICDHHMDPKSNPVAEIARQYTLEPNNVEQVIKYFKPLQVQIPKKDTKAGLLDKTKTSLLSANTFQNLLKSGKEKTTKTEIDPKGSSS